MPVCMITGCVATVIKRTSATSRLDQPSARNFWSGDSDKTTCPSAVGGKATSATAAFSSNASRGRRRVEKNDREAKANASRGEGVTELNEQQTLFIHATNSRRQLLKQSNAEGLSTQNAELEMKLHGPTKALLVVYTSCCHQITGACSASCEVRMSIEFSNL